MSMPVVRLGLVFLISFPVAAAWAQSTIDQSAPEKADATGQRDGAIHSLGAAGYNARENEKDPAIIIPPLNEGPSGTSGAPLGTTVGRRIR